jgi:hypothetical protein
MGVIKIWMISKFLNFDRQPERHLIIGVLEKDEGVEAFGPTPFKQCVTVGHYYKPHRHD